MTSFQTARARQWWVMIGVSTVLTAGCPADDGDAEDATGGQADSGTSVSTTTAPMQGDTTDGSSGIDSSTGDPTTGDEPTSDDTTGGSTTGGPGVCEVIPDPVECTQPGYFGAGVCDPYVQDCPDGQKCLPFDPDGQGAWDTTQCIPVEANPGAEGDPCTMIAGGGVGGQDDCGVGLVCWDLVNNQGTCAQMCGCGEGTPTCDTEGQACAGPYNNGAVAVCRDACVPTDVDACGPNQLCLITPTGLFQCLNGGQDLGLGEACASAQSCAPGLACAASPNCPQGGNCCVEWCDTDEPEACGGECIPLFNGGAPHECYEDVGVCV